MDYSLHEASLSIGFSRQEYWSGLPFPSPGALSDPGIEPRFPALQADSLPSEPPRKKTKVRANWLLRDSPAGPVPLRLCTSKAGGVGSIPGWGTKIPHAAWYSQKYFFFKKKRIYAYLWLIHVDIWQKPTQYCIAIISN